MMLLQIGLKNAELPNPTFHVFIAELECGCSSELKYDLGSGTQTHRTTSDLKTPQDKSFSVDFTYPNPPP